MKNNKERTVKNQANQKTYQYSIRKFTVGAASIAVGAAIFMGGQAQAAEQEGNKEVAVTEQAAPLADAGEKAADTNVAEKVEENKAIAPQPAPAPVANEAATPENEAAPVAEKEVKPVSEAASAPVKVDEKADVPVKVAPEKKAYYSVKEEINKPLSPDAHEKDQRFPVEFKAVKKGTDNEAFYHETNIKHPAQIIKGDKESTVELTLDAASTWDKFEIYNNDQKLDTKMTSYDAAKALAKLQFLVPNGTEKVTVKSSMDSKILRLHEDFGDVELQFAQPINGKNSNHISEEDYKKLKETEAFRNAITLEDKIYQYKKLINKDRVPTQEEKAYLADLEKDLAEEIESAKTEFKNAPIEKVEISNPTPHNFEVLHSKKNEPSHMNFEVVKPMQVFEKDGQKFVAMTIKSDKIWDDFMVAGETGYERVKTIARDAQKDQRTVIFPYQEGVEQYNAIVKVSLKVLDYQGAYHVRIKDLGEVKGDSKLPDADKQEKPAPKPAPAPDRQGDKVAPDKEEMNTAPISKELNFVVKKDGEDKKSVMDDYMEHPAKVIKENNKTYVQFTIKNPTWWKSFELFDGKQKLNTKVVSESDTQKVINVEVKPGTKMLTSKVHIVVPGINYDNKYTTQIVFAEPVSDLKVPDKQDNKLQPKPMPQPKPDHQDKSEEKTPKHDDAVKPSPKKPDASESMDKEKAPKHEEAVKPEPNKPNTTPSEKSEVKPMGAQTDKEHVQDAAVLEPSMKEMSSLKLQPLGTAKAETMKSKADAQSKTANKHVEAQKPKAKSLPKTGNQQESTTTFGILSVFLGSIALFWNRRVKSKKNNL